MASSSSCADGGYASGLAADGLPVVEPTRARVEAMLAGADPDLVLGDAPPATRPVALWQVASCAVLAGAEPRQFSAIVAAVRAVLAPEREAAWELLPRGVFPDAWSKFWRNSGPARPGVSRGAAKTGRS